MKTQYTIFSRGSKRVSGIRHTLLSVAIGAGILGMLMDPLTSAAQTTGSIPSWVYDAVFYQIFPERFANGDTANDPPGVEPWGGRPGSGNYFGGDLKGILDNLDYISSLGVNALYLNPIFEARSNHKYNATDYMRIDPAFGDTQTLEDLIDACHERGIRIILDGVFNHTGVDFFAFADVKEKGPRSPYRNWYNFHGFPVGSVNNPNYDCWWGYGSLPKLMTGNPAVRKYLFGVTRKWMGLKIDGWRLDVANEVPQDFWIAWRKLVKEINPDAYIVGEIWENAGDWLKGDQFDATMNYRFRTACIDFFVTRSRSVSSFDSLLAAQRADYRPEVNFALQNLLGSHDTERFLTLAGGDTATLELAVLFQMTYVGAPMVYYGDEIGMMGGKDPGCRGTMVWDPEKQDRGILDFTRGAIAVRRSHPVWRRGLFETLRVDNDRGVYVYGRRYNGAQGIVVLNAGKKPAVIRLPGKGYESSEFHEVWPKPRPLKREADGDVVVAVPPRTGCVYLQEES